MLINDASVVIDGTFISYLLQETIDFLGSLNN